MKDRSIGVIVIIDDDAELSQILCKLLAEEGFEVKAASSLFQGRGLVERLRPDLVILDRKLPDGDGLALCQEIRENPKSRATPILFLSKKGSVTDKVVGLQVGADDYLPKPFSNEELLARVHALFRRFKRSGQASAALQSGNLSMNLEARKVAIKGKPVTLRNKEFELLEVFLENPERVLSRQYLLERVWGYERGLEVTTRVVDTTVSQLRSKLGPEGKRLVSVLHHGYRLENPA